MAEARLMGGALQGLKVADFSWVGAGPRATKDLADNGAEVIKIESRNRLDLGRLSPPFKDGRKHHDGSAFFAQTNTSKKGVAINLGDPKGQAYARKLVAWADVVVENFAAGFMERIGLSWSELQAIKPDIILVSVSVAGRSGPLARFRGYGNSAAAQSGLAAMSGWPDRPPHMAPFAYGDVVAPMFATVAVLAALEHRRRTGRGQHVDVSQVEPLVHVLADEFARHQQGQEVRLGNGSAEAAPHGVYRCRGYDQWCAIAVETEAQWQALCACTGLAPDPRFADLAGRFAHAEEIDAALAAWCATRNKQAVAETLTAAGVPAAAVQDGRDVFGDPELAAAGHYVRLEHPVLGAHDMPAPPMRFSETPWAVTRSPLLGEHNRAVFVDMLGLSPDEVAADEQAGVLA